MPKITLAVLLLLLSAILSGCDSPDTAKEQTTTQSGQKPAHPKTSKAKPETPLTARSWADIKQSGTIRALKLHWESFDALPRNSSTSDYHRQLLNDFAKENQLSVEWQTADNLEQMFEQLKAHKADIIPRHLTVTENRQQHMSFTLPLKHDVEVLVAKRRTEKPKAKQAVKVAIPKGSSYEETVKKRFKHWSIKPLDTGLNADDIADALKTGTIKYSILDRLALEQLNTYRDDIVELRVLSSSKQLAWAVDKENQTLLNQLNDFIAHHHIEQSQEQDRTSDLNTIKKRKQSLRMITRNSPETYFLWRGELAGFEYELMREFAKRQKIRLEVVVAETFEEMKTLLEQGKGDVIAAGISRTENRKAQLQFSFRYKRVSEMLVANVDSTTIEKLEDLKDRTIVVRKSSAFWQTAQQLAKAYQVKVVAADESIATEMLIEQVADKKIDLTIADSNLVGIEQRYRDNIITPLTLNEGVPYAYAVRRNNPQLLGALNAFIKKEYRNTFYNVVKTRYFGNRKRQQAYREDRITSDSALSPYDDLVKAAAEKYHFDWRLLTSQMFQESRFDPKAQSAAGALGLMQMLPRTAGELGYKDLFKPEVSIQAGAHYLDWTRQRFAHELPVQERLFFALAAYNAGFGHVKDAQKLAAKMNLDPNIWFDNVERAMLLLQYPKYYKKARFGYCRGSEPVNYIREIHQRYLNYLKR